MSLRDTPQPDETISPYLLRPCRTYKEYLREAEAARKAADDEAHGQAAAPEPGYEAG